MTQQLRVLPENPGLISSTHITAHNYNPNSTGFDVSFWHPLAPGMQLIHNLSAAKTSINNFLIKQILFDNAIRMQEGSKTF